jgi:hypothetical protein
MLVDSDMLRKGALIEAILSLAFFVLFPVFLFFHKVDLHYSRLACNVTMSTL